MKRFRKIPGFVVSGLVFLPFMYNEFVSVGIAELGHPADRRLHFIDIKAHSALLQLRNRSVDVVHFEGDGCSVARRFPSGMRTDADGYRPNILLDPGTVHACACGL
jgi:hypothetical protein